MTHEREVTYDSHVGCRSRFSSFGASAYKIDNHAQTVSSFRPVISAEIPIDSTTVFLLCYQYYCLRSYLVSTLKKFTTTRTKFKTSLVQ